MKKNSFSVPMLIDSDSLANLSIFESLLNNLKSLTSLSNFTNLARRPNLSILTTLLDYAGYNVCEISFLLVTLLCSAMLVEGLYREVNGIIAIRSIKNHP